MLVVVGLVLLIACANLASFLLAQAADRKKEIALRLALGARRGRLIQQLLTETTLLALVGGVAGVALAAWMLEALVAADLPLPVPITLDLSLDGAVLGFSLLITVLAGLFFGLAPALHSTRPDLAPTLKDEGTGGGAPRKLTLRNTLVVTQMAVSLVLLVGAGLFLRTLQSRTAIDPGFGYDPSAFVSVQLPLEGYDEAEGRVFFRELLDEVRMLPGVTSAGLTSDIGLSASNNYGIGVNVDGVEPPPGAHFHMLSRTETDSEYFQAAGIQILRGRTFEPTDEAGAPPVAIISQAMADKFWPGEDAIGRVFHGNDQEITVVGVAREAKVHSLGEAPVSFVYLPHEQSFRAFVTVLANTTIDPERTKLDLVALVRRLDPEVLIYEAQTMERHLAVSLLPHRLAALMVTAFGIIALVLASIGLYGVVSYAVATRSREVGIRMSLGAEPQGVVRMLMAGGLRLVGVGTVIGLVLALLASRLVAGLLYGVGATDPVAFTVVPAVLVVVAMLATWIPARRASRVNPVRALKGD